MVLQLNTLLVFVEMPQKLIPLPGCFKIIQRSLDESTTQVLSKEVWIEYSFLSLPFFSSRSKICPNVIKVVKF